MLVPNAFIITCQFGLRITINSLCLLWLSMGLHAAQKQQQNTNRDSDCNIVKKINLKFCKILAKKPSSHARTHTQTKIPTNFNITKVATSNQVIRSRSPSMFGSAVLTCELHQHTKKNRTKQNEKHFYYCFTISFSWTKMCCNSWRDYKYWQFKMPKMVQNNPKQYQNLSNAILIAFSKRPHNRQLKTEGQSKSDEKKTHTNWTENGFTDAVNSWIDGNNMVHLIGGQID